MWPRFCLENGPCAHKKERIASPIPPSPSHWVLGYMGPEGQRTFQQKHQNSWNLVPSLGPARSWPCAHLNEPFPPRLGQVSCPEGAERPPRQRGLGPILAAEGPVGLSPPQLLWGPEALSGGRTKQGVRGGAQAVSWAATPGGVSWNPPLQPGPASPVSQGCPKVESGKSWAGLPPPCSLQVTMAASAEKPDPSEPGTLQEPSPACSAQSCLTTPLEALVAASFAP